MRISSTKHTNIVRLYYINKDIIYVRTQQVKVKLQLDNTDIQWKKNTLCKLLRGKH